MSCLHKAASYPSLALICEILGDKYTNSLCFDSRLRTPSQMVPHNYLSSHKITLKSENRRFAYLMQAPLFVDEFDELTNWNPGLNDDNAVSEVPHVVVDNSEQHDVSCTNTNRSHLHSDRLNPSATFERRSEQSIGSRQQQSSLGMGKREQFTSQSPDMTNMSHASRHTSVPKKFKFNKLIAGPSSFCEYGSGSKQKRFIRDILHLPTNMLKDLRKELGQSPLSLNFNNMSAKNPRTGTEWNHRSEFSLEPPKRPPFIGSQKAFFAKNYTNNAGGRLIKADSDCLDDPDMDVNCSLNKPRLHLYPTDHANYDPSLRYPGTPDSSRGVGENDDSRTLDRPSISTRPLTKTLGLFRPSINEVRALMMFPTPLSRADRDRGSANQSQEHDEKQVIVRNRILANLIKGTEAVQKFKLGPKHQHLGLIQTDLTRQSKNAQPPEDIAGNQIRPKIEIFKATTQVNSQLFFSSNKPSPMSSGWDSKAFEQAVVKVSHLSHSFSRVWLRLSRNLRVLSRLG